MNHKLIKNHLKPLISRKDQNLSKNSIICISNFYIYVRSNQHLIEQFQELAGKYKLPNFYIYYTLLPLKLPSTSITQYLFKEKKELKEQASNYHKISTSVRARQECLERLRKTLGELTEEKLEESRVQLKEEIQHYRFLTENVIDQMKKWRDSLGKID